MLSGFKPPFASGEGRFRHFAANAGAAAKFGTGAGSRAVIWLAARIVGGDFPEFLSDPTGDLAADVATNACGRDFAAFLADAFLNGRIADGISVKQWIRDKFGIPVTSTAFTLSPNPVTVTGSWTSGTGGCGAPTTFTDTLTISLSGSTITINQPSTGDRNTGTINPDGSFSASQTTPPESYVGTLQSNGAGTAVNRYTDTNNCTTTWQVTLSPQGSQQAPLRVGSGHSLDFKRRQRRR